MMSSTPVATTQAAKAEHLRQLHQQPRLLELLNVWDVASARAVAARPETTAIATASAAIAATHGYDDGECIPWPLHLACLERICAAVQLPVTVDIERGYGDPVATMKDVLAAGAVGVNLEDALAPTADFVATLRAVRQAAEQQGVPVVINARADEFLLSAEPHPDEAVARAEAYLDAGADFIFMPGLVDRDTITQIVQTIGESHLNLLALPGIPPMADLEGLGVCRVSHGPEMLEAVEAFLRSWPRLSTPPPHRAL